MPRHKSKINADQRKAQPTKTSVAPSTLYDVEMVPSAAIVYKNLYEKMKRADAKGEQSSSHHTVFRMVRDAIKNIIPRDPLNKNYALTGPLAGYFRIKKGRHRICWAASSTARKICIVFISETLRKEGDANDPYEIFTKLVLSGGFDKFLGHMGIPKPPRNFSAGVTSNSVAIVP